MAILEDHKTIKDEKGRVIKTAGGPRKVRCRKCWNMSIRQPDHNGDYVYRCLGCGAQTLSTTI